MATTTLLFHPFLSLPFLSFPHSLPSPPSPRYDDWRNSPHAASVLGRWEGLKTATDDRACALLSEATEIFVKRVLVGAVRAAQSAVDLEGARLVEAQKVGGNKGETEGKEAKGEKEGEQKDRRREGEEKLYDGAGGGAAAGDEPTRGGRVSLFHRQGEKREPIIFPVLPSCWKPLRFGGPSLY